MQIFLSPTGIQDYLVCSKRMQYRMLLKDLGEESTENKSDAMKVGLIVHTVIEKSWKIYDPFLIDNLINEYKIVKEEDLKKLNRCLNNFYSKFSNLLSDEDVVEKLFKIPWNREVTIVGKMDRILPKDKVVIDWKTGYSAPETVENNIQFMLYYWAYRKMYKSLPNAVYYVDLFKGKILPYGYNEMFYRVMEKEIIPMAIESAKYNKFYREGMFRGKCEDKYSVCPFKRICWEEA